MLQHYVHDTEQMYINLYHQCKLLSIRLVHGPSSRKCGPISKKGGPLSNALCRASEPDPKWK